MTIPRLLALLLLISLARGPSAAAQSARETGLTGGGPSVTDLGWTQQYPLLQPSPRSGHGLVAYLALLPGGVPGLEERVRQEFPGAIDGIERGAVAEDVAAIDAAPEDQETAGVEERAALAG